MGFFLPEGPETVNFRATWLCRVWSVADLQQQIAAECHEHKIRHPSGKDGREHASASQCNRDGMGGPI